jgi:hypothetical protein
MKWFIEFSIFMYSSGWTHWERLDSREFPSHESALLWIRQFKAEKLLPIETEGLKIDDNIRLRAAIGD